MQLKDLAAYLEIDILILEQELAGTKTMGTKRSGQLKKLLAKKASN